MKVKTNLPAWRRSIEGKTLHGRRRLQTQVPTLKIYPVLSQDLPLAIREGSKPEFWRDVAQQFVRTDLLPFLADKYFEKANNTIHWPRVIDYKDGLPATGGRSKYPIWKNNTFDRRAKERNGKRVWRLGNLAQGFVNLFKEISVAKYKIDERAVRIGIGPMQQVKRLRLNEYMPTFGGKGMANDSPNTFFYAVEFGTGVEENVGHKKYIRTEGDTKDDELPGSWWLGPDKGMGVHFVGQKGFHLFFDERTRMANPWLLQEVQRRWEVFVLKYLENHPFFGNKLTAKRFG